jgi:uncharacterized protein (TIGR03435 family)
MMRALTAIAFAALVCSPVLAQSPPKFDAADVHASPANNLVIGADGGALRGDRYVLRQATMLDLISKAYSLDPANVQGGPSWLEMNRYDIIAKAAPGTPPATIKLMLQSLLTERFALTTHPGTKPMPAYILTLGKSKPKLKESAGEHSSGCDFNNLPPLASGVRQLAFTCHDKTMDELAEDLHGIAGAYLPNPVINQTGLAGIWDYDLTFTGRGQLAKAGADGISIFDAVDKQLGLKLDLETAPRPVLLVDSVREQPTPNSPDLAKLMPPLPPATFDVAVIKPAKAGEEMRGQMSKDQVNIQNFPLKFLIAVAWNFNPQEDGRIIGPKWLDTDHFDILAKLNVDTAVAKNNNVAPVDPADFVHMLQALVIERFNMQSHMEDRELMAYTLTAATPKLKPTADPTARTRCVEGPGPDGKDPRITNPVLNRLLTCTNMTMPQIAHKFQELANGYIFGDVLDRTGLPGAYDFTISFSSAGQTGGGGAAPPSSDPSEPTGALTLSEAVSRQLGLKLEKQKRPVSVLVIDHIDEKPTEN